MQNNKNVIYEKPEIELMEFYTDILTLSGYDEGDNGSGDFGDFGTGSLNM